ncbi:MAG TPA: hypothetical protein VHC86_06805 [Opitutaceae bacterium]|nr:hypothetical protein [Opitutaceae bacterium]
MNTLNRWAGRLPAPLRPILASALSLLAGLAVALVLHYVLYRVGLPSKPFIYVSF